jgi:hypothetical protein
MAAPRIAPDVFDPERGGPKVMDPRSRSSSTGTAISVSEPPPTTVGPTGMFGPGGIYSGLTRKRVGSRRRPKKKTKKAGRRKSRR